MFTRITDQLYLFQDTCNVYVLCSGVEAVLIDFGSGDVLDHLDRIGVERVTDVLMTHHHRDQGQGLARAVHRGIRIWVPHTEQDLFHSVDAHWQARELYQNYNVRQDRFSLLESIPVDGTLQDYETRLFGDLSLTVLPTPGHTTGSISLLVELQGKRILFCGDLIAAPGKVLSLSATQWTYNGAEGVAAGLASLLDLQDRQLDVLLPSHGLPIHDPAYSSCAKSHTSRFCPRARDRMEKEHPISLCTAPVWRIVMYCFQKAEKHCSSILVTISSPEFRRAATAPPAVPGCIPFRR
jgi:glyoxylase-like metal-dependent hydrolase (beta-lactamase superfamily II)